MNGLGNPTVNGQRRLHADVARSIHEIGNHISTDAVPIIFCRKAVKSSSNMENLPRSNGAFDDPANGISVLAQPDKYIGIREDSRFRELKSLFGQQIHAHIISYYDTIVQ